METTNTTVSGFCQCSFKAPGLYTFTSPAFAKAQAIALCALGLSATQTVDWALEELLEHHKGQIIGPRTSRPMSRNLTMRFGTIRDVSSITSKPRPM